MGALHTQACPCAHTHMCSYAHPFRLLSYLKAQRPVRSHIQLPGNEHQDLTLWQEGLLSETTCLTGQMALRILKVSHGTLCLGVSVQSA